MAWSNPAIGNRSIQRERHRCGRRIGVLCYRYYNPFQRDTEMLRRCLDYATIRLVWNEPIYFVHT